MSLKTKKVILGAGCFWGVEELFREVPGILDTEVGYCGGDFENPKYKDICTGKTGHAESLWLEYDESKISLSKILELFFKLHNPTTLNRQGNDVGSQYRSVIFYQNAEELAVAKSAIEKAQGNWKDAIVTSLEPLNKFYSAEVEHQDYLRKNPGGYTCHYWREENSGV